MEALEERRLLVADLTFTNGGGTSIPDNYHPLDPSIISAANTSFHGGDHVGKDGPLARAGIDLTILFHENQEFGDSRPPSNLQLQVQNNRVAVDVTARGSVSAMKSQLSGLGMTILGETDRQVTGLLPISAIDNMAALSSVGYARPAYRPITAAGPTDSEGDQALKSNLGRAKYDVDGTGITVGVISDSFNALVDPANPNTTGAAVDYQTCVVAGTDCELSPVSVLQDDPTGTDEGRAMLQIVHDVAPGATLAFATAGFSEIDAADATRRLQDAGADVIVDDINFTASPFFQDGLWARAVNEVADDGVVYVSAAGNFGTSSWEGEFVGSGQSGELGGPLHDFNPGSGVDAFIEINAPVGEDINIVLQWDQPFGSLSADGISSASDVDLYLYGADRSTYFAFSVDNNVGGDPLEQVFYQNTGLNAAGLINDLDGDGVADETFYLAISHVSGPAPSLMKFIAFDGEIAEYETNSGTTVSQKNADGAITVAASAYDLTPSFGVSPPILNDFSSLGGGSILFDNDGNRIAADRRLKPEVTGVDGVATTVPGFAPFYGTSAAAPHIAGVAALMLENAGGPDELTPGQVKSILQASTIDIVQRMDPFATPNGFSLPTEDIPDGIGFDYFSGFGLVDAAKAIAASEGLETGPGSISGTIFEDVDRDGEQDRLESGVAGWTVFIDLDRDGIQDIAEPSTTTDGNGDYTISDLPYGDYQIAYVAQGSWLPTVLETNSQNVRVGFGTDVNDVDFAVRRQVSRVLGTVFHDLNENGLRDSGEPGIENALVHIDEDGDGIVSIFEPSVLTDSNGEYEFSGLDLGELSLKLATLAGWVPTGSTEIAVPISDEEMTVGIDFGLAPRVVDPGVVDPDPNVNPPDPNSGTDPTTGYVEGFILGEAFGVADGVVFVRGLSAGTTQEIAVIASQVSVSRGYLHAWIDFNGDETLSADEQILRNQRLEDGLNVVEIDIPAGVTATDVLARFRWDFEYNEAPTGPSRGGEVEDYIVSIPMEADARLVAGVDNVTVDEDSTDNVISVLGNDSVGPLGGTKQVVGVGEAANGVVLFENGEIVYTPNPDFIGTDSFSYTLGDGNDNTTQGHVNVTVVNTNDPPTAVDDTFEVVVDASGVTLDVLANDTFTPDLDETLTIESFTLPPNGALGKTSDGTHLIYTPDVDFIGVDEFDYTISDGNGATATAHVTIHVVEAEQLVRIDLQPTDADENPITSISTGELFYVDVIVNDLRDNPEGVFSAYLDMFYESSRVSIHGDIEFGDLFAGGQNADLSTLGEIDEAGGVSGTDPNNLASVRLLRVPFIASTTGTVSFVGDWSDEVLHEVSLYGGGAVAEKQISFRDASLIIVGAVDDHYTIEEDTTSSFDVLANDAGITSTSLSLASVTATEQGGVVSIVNGEIDYTPPANFFGTDTFEYTVMDTGQMSTALVTVTVVEVNDDPIAVDDEKKISPNATNEIIRVLDNDSISPDVNEVLRITGVDQPLHGTVMVADDNTQLTYTPDADFEGTDTFDYTIGDFVFEGNNLIARGGSATATVTIEVRATVAFRLEVTDVNGNPITTARVGDQFILSGYVEDVRDDPTGVFSGYFDVNYSANLATPAGSIEFEDSIYDGARSGSTEVPGLIDEVGGIDGITPLGGGEFFLFSLPMTARAEGALNFTSDSADNTPKHEISVFDDGGSDTPEAVSDDLIRFGTTSLAIREDGAVSDEYSVSEDSQANILSVLDNDVVPVNQEPKTVVEVSTGDQGGTIGIVNDTTISYTPAPNFFGTEKFTYTIRDATGQETSAPVTVNVTPTNDPPTVNNDSFVLMVNSTDNTLDVLLNDTYLPDAPETLTISNVSTPNQGGSIQISPGGQDLVYSPPADYVGQEMFTYTVSDGNGGTAEGVVNITIQPEMTDPLANFIVEYTDLDGNSIDTIAVDEPFQIRVSVQDLRDNPIGLFSAYMDLMYPAGLLDVNGDIAFNNSVYPAAHSGSTSIDGLIDELGAVDGISEDEGLGGDPILLATIPVIATATGTAIVTTDPADRVPPNETTLFGTSRLVRTDEIVFGTDTIEITGEAAAAPQFHNASNPFDVNNDDFVSPLDALLVINRLSSGGPLTGSGQRAEAAAGSSGVATIGYVDVNGDHHVSPLDALLVINQLVSSAAAPPAQAPLGVQSTHDDLGGLLIESAADDLASTRQTYDVAHELAMSDDGHDEGAGTDTIDGRPTYPGWAKGVALPSRSAHSLDEVLEDFATDVTEEWKHGHMEQ